MDIYRGTVTDTADPMGLLRVRIQCPQLLGTAVSDWAWPVLPPTFLETPQLGDPVWVMFEGGDIDKPLWLGTWITTPPAGTSESLEDAEANFYMSVGV